MTDERITELETKLAFAEDMLDTLNQAVIRQQLQLDQLQQQIRLLHQQLRDAPTGETRSPDEELPPHY